MRAMPLRFGCCVLRGDGHKGILEKVSSIMRHSPYEVGIATAETIARRLPILWWGMVFPGGGNQAEITKMVIEKQMALAESVFALQAEMFKMALRPWWQWSAASHRSDADGMMQAAMAPAARRVKANVRRLRLR
jgi:hypothetical protein